MKSAYELAMERLTKESGPAKKLSKKAKAAIADIESKCDAQAAQARLQYEPKIATAESLEEMQMLQGRLGGELAAIEARRQKEKDAVWNAE
ncbi:MAG: hypothetical protein QG656_2533 [Candidatus Hydrogenedentes bacterium]|nr:hypothetical protein [Candidatus Hydrogenedentota bacterium]